ncbi:MAG: hypothetical protein HY719_05575, partial [Planctomycetes bacterium]|nr:hypothetical protein [Planctomycetota bacterium]
MKITQSPLLWIGAVIVLIIIAIFVTQDEKSGTGDKSGAPGAAKPDDRGGGAAPTAPTPGPKAGAPAAVAPGAPAPAPVARAPEEALLPKPDEGRQQSDALLQVASWNVLKNNVEEIKGQVIRLQERDFLDFRINKVVRRGGGEANPLYEWYEQNIPRMEDPKKRGGSTWLRFEKTVGDLGTYRVWCELREGADTGRIEWTIQVEGRQEPQPEPVTDGRDLSAGQFVSAALNQTVLPGKDVKSFKRPQDLKPDQITQLPAAAYYNATNGDLMFAQMTEDGKYDVEIV